MTPHTEQEKKRYETPREKSEHAQDNQTKQLYNRRR